MATVAVFSGESGRMSVYVCECVCMCVFVYVQLCESESVANMYKM